MQDNLWTKQPKNGRMHTFPLSRGVSTEAASERDDNRKSGGRGAGVTGGVKHRGGEAAALALAATASEGEAQLVFSRILLQDGGQVAWQRRLAGSEARLGSEGPPLPSRGRCGVDVAWQHANLHRMKRTGQNRYASKCGKVK